MTTKSALLRAEPHATVGSVVLRDAGLVIERWAVRAREEQPAAKRVHHDVLLDHLPTFLWELGRLLSEAHPKDRPSRAANVHGDQRWEVGWSVEEVVRDYQILRIVLTEHLDETVGRPLRTREVLALGVFIDDAIAASVAAYTACQGAAAPPTGHSTASKEGISDDLLAVLGVLGHELRNPLAPLGNAIEVLRVSGPDTGVADRIGGILDRQVRVMTRLVDDLLDLPRLVRGKVKLQPTRVDLAALARDLVEDRRDAFEAAGIAVSSHLPADPVYSSGDAARLSQVLGNLLQNALKFTDPGGSVLVRLWTEDARRVAVLSVKDTGLGIERSLLPRVFDPFVQADRSMERSRGGIGLGLALVKGLAELHGGTVRAASDGPGKGSEFVVELPLIDRQAVAPVPAAPPAETTSRRVLIVEDNRDSAESLKMYLELLGHRVTVAYTGPTAIEAGRAAAPEVVVCDIGLPGMSGHAVCAELRKLPGCADTLFVAVSGHAPETSAADAANGGFDLHLVKPVEPARLAETISTRPRRTPAR